MQAPTAVFCGWHKPSCEHHLGCLAEILFQLSCDRIHFSKVERCVFILSSLPLLQKCLTISKLKTQAGSQSGCCDLIIKHRLDLFYFTPNHIQRLSYSAIRRHFVLDLLRIVLQVCG